MTAVRGRAHLAFVALLYGVALVAALAQSGTIWTWLFASPLAIGGGYFCSLGAELPDEPLKLPAIEALDLRPLWERNPILDEGRRGERAWISGLEIAMFGWYYARPLGYRGRNAQLTIYEAFTARTDRPRMARLRLPRIERLDLRTSIPGLLVTPEFKRRFDSLMDGRR